MLSRNKLKHGNLKTVYVGYVNHILFLGPKIWNIILSEFKEETSLDDLKKLIKNGSLKTFHVGYVNHTYKISVLLKSHGNCFFRVVYDLNISVFYLTDID